MANPESTPHQEISFRDIFTPIWVERKRVLVISVVVALVVLGVNFVLPKSFKAVATLLPEADKGKLGLTNQFAGLASLAGVNLASGDISRLYPMILTSESVLTGVIQRKYATERFKDSVTLIQYFEIDDEPPAKSLDEALNTLKGLMAVSFDIKTSVVSVSLEMREPQLAADVLNSALHELDAFLKEKKSNTATEQRKWIESRLVQVNSELRRAEEVFKNFREKNRRVTDSPELMLEQERLSRDVQVKSTIDVELLKQAELAKIEEIKQISTISVLDEGRAPLKKSGPKRATNTAIAFVLALACTSGYYSIRSLYGKKISTYIRSYK